MKLVRFARQVSLLRKSATSSFLVTILAIVCCLIGLSPAGAHSKFPRSRGGELAPLFQLVDHNGERLTRAQIRGKPFIVVFGFTYCPSFCPTALLDITNLLADLGPDGDRIKVLS